MSWLLIVVQLVLWIVGGQMLVILSGIENTFIKVVIFGVTGIGSMFLCTMIAKKMGFHK